MLLIVSDEKIKYCIFDWFLSLSVFLNLPINAASAKSKVQSTNFAEGESYEATSVYKLCVTYKIEQASVTIIQS